MSRIASRLTAAALAAGAIVAVAAMPASAADHGRHQGQGQYQGQHQGQGQGRHQGQDQHQGWHQGQYQQGQGRQHQQRPQVVLGSVQYNSPGVDNRSQRSLNAEWVTLTNESRRAVDLNGWTLTGTDHRVYRFRHVTLGGHQSVRVHSGRGHDTARDLYQGRTDYVWDNRADTATLRDDRGHVVDTESWGRRHH